MREHAFLPPTVAQLVAAYRQLPAGAPLRPAMLHLAAPERVVPGATAGYSRGEFVLRGYRYPDRSTDPQGVAQAVLAVVWAGQEDDDRFLDLSAAPSSWVKRIRSGAADVCFGVDSLFGGPLTRAEVGVPDAVVAAYVDAVRDGGAISGGVIVAGEDVGLVDRDGHGIVLRRGDRTEVGAAGPVGTVEPRLRAAQLASMLRGWFRADRCEVSPAGSRFPGTHDFVVRVRLDGGWIGRCPLTVGGTSQQIGADRDVVAAVPESLPLPSGFVPLGYAPDRVSIVAVHGSTGVALSMARAQWGPDSYQGVDPS